MKTTIARVAANICATSQLFYQCVLRIIASFTIILLGLTSTATCSIAAEPPMPPAPQPLGRQNPYMSTVVVTNTATVTTVYTVKYLRTIELEGAGTTNAHFETNYVLLRTNILSVTTNSVIVNPP